MILLLDMGNSALKWATLEEGTLSPMARSTWGDSDNIESLESLWSELALPEHVLVSSVAGDERAAAITAWVRDAWRLETEFVQATGEGFGVINAYIEPRRLGVDRWCALVAVKGRFHGAVCVVDCGTAITIDVLSGEGRHLGGVIIPGLGLMRRSLVEHTSINLQEDGHPGGIALLARDTRDAIMGGTLYSAIAAIDRIIQDITKELGSTPTCVITGGDAQGLLPLLAADYHHIPDLVLQGLARMAKVLR